MDPDAALAEIRTILDRPDGGDELLPDLLRVAELIRGLDEWLSGGGFLPGPWTPAQFPSARRVISISSG